MHLKKKQNKKEKWALRAYLFSSPMVVEYDYGSLQSPFQALTNGSLQSSISLPSSLIFLWEPSIFLPSSSISLQSPQELARTLARVKTLLAKTSEMDEMRNRMREMGVKECFNLLPNPRLPFPCFISPKKTKTKLNFYLLMRVSSGSVFGERFFPRERTLPEEGACAPSSWSVRSWTLLERSLKNQGAHFSLREHAP
jgi:hypothetical protein